MSHTIQVHLGERSYPIHIHSQNFSLSEVSALIQARKVVIFSNDCVAPLYLQTLIDELQSCQPATIEAFVWQDGEPHKNLNSWSEALDFLAEKRIHRSDLIISLGGGVVCDMSGFVAASWMRGVDLIQIPTTLLAQIDASVGGKTAINHPKGKNLIGAFHQPQAVLINTQVLETLSTREYVAGIGEAIKYGYINQPDFLSWVDANSSAILAKDSGSLAHLIQKCCEFKAEIVALDEKEQGCRALLNLGHTFGHAIESLTGYEQYLHGEAVALGMIMAAECSILNKMCSVDLKQNMIRLFEKFDLPTRLDTNVSAEDMVESMKLDKKAQNNFHKLILINEVEQKAEVVTGITDQILMQSIHSCL